MDIHARALRILVAENEDMLRRGIESLLQDRPEWKICGEAATVTEAIEKTMVLLPDLLLMDIALPGGEALNAIPHIMNVCPGVKIIALTKLDSAELAANALAAGANGILLTSEAATDLILSVESVSKNQTFLSPAAVTMLRSHLSKSAPIEANRLAALTPRELEILRLLAKGLGMKKLAAMLVISVKTVHAHRLAIMQKLGLHSYWELIQFAIKHGLCLI